MISNRDMNLIAMNCYAVVAHSFAEFLNLENRGSNFVWDRFPDLVKVRCYTQIYVMNIGNKKNKQECLSHAEATGEEIAKRLLKESGLVP